MFGVEGAALAIALSSNAILIVLTYREGIECLRREFDFAAIFVIVWSAIWLGWQLLALRNFMRAKDGDQHA
jgi:hypothetical protein